MKDQDLRTALAWYGEQARLARLIHSEGDPGRHALAEDGGKRAAAILAAPPRPVDAERVEERTFDDWDVDAVACKMMDMLDAGALKEHAHSWARSALDAVAALASPAHSPDKAVTREGVEDDARDAQYKAEQAEEAECDALFRAETAEAEITRLQAIIAALAPQPNGTEASRGLGAVPAGWKLVPEKPTPEMLKAGYGEHWSWSSGRAYRAMIAATPTPPLSPDSTGPAKELWEREWRPGNSLPKDGSWFRGLDLESWREADAHWSDGHDACFRGRNGEVLTPSIWHPLAALTPSAPIAAPVRDDGARERIAQAMYDHDCKNMGPLWTWDQANEKERVEYYARADAVLASLPAPAGDVPGEAQTRDGWMPIAELKPQTNAVLGRWARAGDNEDGSEFWYWQEATGRWFDHAGERHWCLRDAGAFEGGPFYGETPTHFHPIPEKPARVEAQTQEGGR